MTAKKSMVDAAYEALASKKRAVQFAKLWQEVKKATGVDDDMVGQFYSDLTLDSRFARLKENKWDLRDRRKYSETHFDLSKIELDDSDGEYLKDDEDENPSYDDEN